MSGDIYSVLSNADCHQQIWDELYPTNTSLFCNAPLIALESITTTILTENPDKGSLNPLCSTSQYVFVSLETQPLALFSHCDADEASLGCSFWHSRFCIPVQIPPTSTSYLQSCCKTSKSFIREQTALGEVESKVIRYHKCVVVRCDHSSKRNRLQPERKRALLLMLRWEAAVGWTGLIPGPTGHKQPEKHWRQ